MLHLCLDMTSSSVSGSRSGAACSVAAAARVSSIGLIRARAGDASGWVEGARLQGRAPSLAGEPRREEEEVAAAREAGLRGGPSRQGGSV
jgi:hypothetical protein